MIDLGKISKSDSGQSPGLTVSLVVDGATRAERVDDGVRASGDTTIVLAGTIDSSEGVAYTPLWRFKFTPTTPETTPQPSFVGAEGKAMITANLEGHYHVRFSAMHQQHEVAYCMFDIDAYPKVLTQTVTGKVASVAVLEPRSHVTGRDRYDELRADFAIRIAGHAGALGFVMDDRSLDATPALHDAMVTLATQAFASGFPVTATYRVRERRSNGVLVALATARVN